MVEYTDPDRDRALFQPVDRNYILGKRTYDIPQQRYRRERTIRDRFAGGLQDIRLFQREANEKLLRKLLPDGAREQRRMRDDMASAIALYFELHEAGSWDFEDTLTRAIEEAYNYGPSRRETLPFRIVTGHATLPQTEPAPLGTIKDMNERIQEKRARGEMLTDREVRFAVEFGNIETKTGLREYLHERRRRDERDDWADRVFEDVETFSEDANDVEK